MANNLSTIRKEELSLFHYIKDIVLPFSNFVEIDEKIPLKLNEDLSSKFNDKDSNTDAYVYDLDIEPTPAPYDRGRGFLYFDLVSGTDNCNYYYTVSGTRVDGKEIYGVPEQSDMVKVYDSALDLIDSSNYMLDYVDCRVVTKGKKYKPAYIDYWWNYVSLIDNWEKAAKVDPPIVVVDFVPSVKSGYQLGGGKKVCRDINIYIFASSSIEKNEIIEVLYDSFYLKSIPIYEFPLGDVLDYDGTWYGRKTTDNKLTSLFDRTTSSFTKGNAFFSDVVVRDVKADLISRAENVFLSDVNKYRAKIQMEMIYYTL